MKMRKTLEQILENEKAHRVEGGDYGVNACKDSIRMTAKYTQKSLYQLLEEYVQRANADVFFNDRMVLACWELINEQ